MVDDLSVHGRFANTRHAQKDQLVLSVELFNH